MAQTMSESEQVLRSELAAAIGTLRTVVNTIPVTSEPLPHEAALTVTGANGALMRTEALAEELAKLEDATHETVLLAANATQALAMMRSCLALLCAEVDSRLAA